MYPSHHISSIPPGSACRAVCLLSSSLVQVTVERGTSILVTKQPCQPIDRPNAKSRSPNGRKIGINKLASLGYASPKLRNYDSLTHLLTGVKCRATSVAKKLIHFYIWPCREGQEGSFLWITLKNKIMVNKQLNASFGFDRLRNCFMNLTIISCIFFHIWKCRFRFLK